MTDSDIAVGAAALEAYAEGVSWWKAKIAEMQTPTLWREGAIDIIKAADAGTDQSPAGRQTSAVAGLHSALKSVGHEAELTAQQYHDAAAVVLAAVHKLRGK